MAAPLQVYGLSWPKGTDRLGVEFAMLRAGGFYEVAGKKYGNGLFFHYKEAQKLLWPEDDHHRWSDLALKAMVENEVSVFMGCGDSGKTMAMSRFVLVDWWAWPEETLWIISSTEYRGAELRIWGKIKELFNRGRKRWPWLSGNVLESMHAITTEEIDEERERARSLQRGLILVPCKQGGTFVGLAPYIGIKAPRLRHAGDEVSVMQPAFLDAYSNWYGKANFKGIMSGNPLDITDPLCKAGEPEEGWENFVDDGKTQTWRSRFFNAAVIAFDGRDSPNFDFPSLKPRYPYLISNKKLDAVRKSYGEDSWQWFNQCVGKPNKGMALRRVITSQLCRKHGAHDSALWEDTKHTMIYALDPAYGGGDRCVGGPIEFGLGLDGKEIIKCYTPEIIPINLRIDVSAEDQIAAYVKQRLEALGIKPENAFYDSCGKGTLGFAFARVFGKDTPVPVDSGASPTERPVRFDLFVDDGNGGQRLKTCAEEYSKFITEMWFSVRECIEGNQLRELPKEVMEEGCLRTYSIVKGNRTEIEPKDELKERIGKSPDLFDWLAVAVEGARRRGFKIMRLGLDPKKENPDDAPDNDSAEFHSIIKSCLLTHN